MRGAIVDLERADPAARGHDRPIIIALLVTASLFAAFIGSVRTGPAAAPQLRSVGVIDSSAVQRGVVPRALQLPADYTNVELQAMPERLTNEASPASLRGVITVRGLPGVASVETPAVISWSEAGIVYWLISPSRTTNDLIRIADELVP